jgi:hypothetical protein
MVFFMIDASCLGLEDRVGRPGLSALAALPGRHIVIVVVEGEVVVPKEVEEVGVRREEEEEIRRAGRASGRSGRSRRALRSTGSRIAFSFGPARRMAPGMGPVSLVATVYYS